MWRQIAHMIVATSVMMLTSNVRSAKEIALAIATAYLTQNQHYKEGMESAGELVAATSGTLILKIGAT